MPLAHTHTHTHSQRERHAERERERVRISKKKEREREWRTPCREMRRDQPYSMKQCLLHVTKRTHSPLYSRVTLTVNLSLVPTLLLPFYCPSEKVRRPVRTRRGAPAHHRDRNGHLGCTAQRLHIPRTVRDHGRVGGERDRSAHLQVAEARVRRIRDHTHGRAAQKHECGHRAGGGVV